MDVVQLSFLVPCAQTGMGFAVHAYTHARVRWVRVVLVCWDRSWWCACAEDVRMGASVTQGGEWLCWERAGGGSWRWVVERGWFDDVVWALPACSVQRRGRMRGLGGGCRSVG